MFAWSRVAAGARHVVGSLFLGDVMDLARAVLAVILLSTFCVALVRADGEAEDRLHEAEASEQAGSGIEQGGAGAGEAGGDTADVSDLERSQEGPSLAELRFIDQPIVDVLMVLADVGGRSIIADETVEGRTTYHFSDTDFDSALRGFLDATGLHAMERNGIIRVSAIAAEATERGVSIRGDAVPLESAVRAIGDAAGVTVVHDKLPSERITLRASDVPVERALEMVVRRHDEFRVVREDEYYYLAREERSGDDSVRDGKTGANVVRGDAGYGVETTRVRLSDLLLELFAAGEREFSIFMRADPTLDHLSFSEREFEELLRLILDRAGADYALDGEVYIIYEIDRGDILARYTEIERVTLEHITVGRFTELLPRQLGASGLYRSDPERNQLILAGSPEQLAPLTEFIALVDRPHEGRRLERFELEYRSVSRVVGMLPEHLSARSPVVVEENNAFLIAVDDDERGEIDRLLELVDREDEASPIALRYLRVGDLLERLPPSVEREHIVATADPTLIFFDGSAERRRRFLSELAEIDRPVPQIRYDVLVVQYEEGAGMGYGSSVEVIESEEDAGFEQVLVGSIGRLLSLNFDVVSTFGYQFAARLNAELSRNSAQVLADTTVNALSGEEARFQNTETFRYRDVEIDPDTGEARPTGVTREVTAGLIVGIEGWASGDGMITMRVSTTLSSRGSGGAAGTDAPPTTSERVIDTNVRTRTGEPLVLGGLVQESSEERVEPWPILGRIPGLGRLFERRREQVQSTELAVYVVPHVEEPPPADDAFRRGSEALYERFLEPTVREWRDE